MKMVEILIPNRYTFNSVILTVESIIRRTVYPHFWVTVCDNSLAENRFVCEPHERATIDGDDGNRRLWLRVKAREGWIRLIENKDQGRLYGHGENIRVLLDQCTADYAFLLNANSEIVRPDWISVLVNMMTDSERDLGVARYRAGGPREHDYIAPTYWPNIMLLDMKLYREHFAGHSWELKQVGFEDFDRPEIFAGQGVPNNPERVPPLVFCDTGYTLWEKLMFDNPAGLRMLPLPENYHNAWIRWRGGIDRNSHRPDHPYVVETLREVNAALDRLRAEYV
jgi:hypothetical protein